jgi:hypothetical protein
MVSIFPNHGIEGAMREGLFQLSGGREIDSNLEFFFLETGPKLASNLQSSYFGLPSAEITGVNLHA